MGDSAQALAPVVALPTAVAEPPAAAVTSRRTVVMAALIGLAIGLSTLLGSFYDVDRWGPLGIVVLVAIMAVTVAGPPRLAPAVIAPVALLALLAVFQWLSQNWSEAVGDTLIEANRTAVYAAMLGLLVMLLRGRAPHVAFLAGLVAGAVIAGAVEVIRLVGPDAPGQFVAGRLNSPIGYYNAEAAALLVPVWPAIALAETARRSLVRGAALGLATFAVLVSLLAESRGAMLALAVSAVVLLLVVPGRRVRLVAVLVAGAAIAIAGGTVLHVYDTLLPGTGVPQASAVHAALRASALAAAGAGIVWALLSWAVARSARLAGRLQATSGSPAAKVAGAVVLVAVAAALAPSIGHTVKRQWHEFTHLKPVTAQLRLTSAGGNRYDYWRVAWHEFRDHPVAGIGAGDYTRDYFRERRTTEDVRQPHSIWLQALAETGIVGFLLLLAVVATIALAARRCARRARRDRTLGALTVAASGISLLWLVHTSVDWLHLLPGLTAGTLGSAAVLLDGARWSPAPRVGRQLHFRPIVFVASTLAAASLGLLTVAAILTEQGQDALALHPGTAASKARQALRLNDQDLDSYYLLAAAFARNDQYADARSTLLRAATLQPHNFTPVALLGDLAVRRRDLPAAAAAYRKASQLNPRNVELRQDAARTAREAAAAR